MITVYDFNNLTANQQDDPDEMPIIYRLSIRPEYVAAGNIHATRSGVRKGMLLNLVVYFCWKPLIITVDDIEKVPKEN